MVATGLAAGLAGCGSGIDEYSAGQAAEGRGDIQGAVGDYGKAAASDDKSLYRLGTLEMDQKQYADAAGAWEKYVALKPKSANGWDNLGRAYEQAGEIGKAEEAYKKGMEVATDDHSAQINYGLMLVRHGREEEGRKLLVDVMKPEEVEASVQAARVQKGK
jgi:tetratricopeptide (TPR) repeat protein